MSCESSGSGGSGMAGILNPSSCSITSSGSFLFRCPPSIGVSGLVLCSNLAVNALRSLVNLSMACCGVSGACLWFCCCPGLAFAPSGCAGLALAPFC